VTAATSAESTRDARGAGVNVLGLVAQAALPAFHVQLARFLGAGGYGVYTWSQTFVDLFSVVTLFGCDQAVMRSVSLDRERSARAVGSALRVVVLSGALVFAAIFIGAPWIARVQDKPALVAPLRCLALVPIFYHVSTIFLVATQALGVMRFAFWARSIVQPLVLLASTGIALRAGCGASGAAAAVAIGMGVTAIVSASLYARALPLGPAVRAAFTGALDREMMRVAFPLVLAGLLWALVSRVDALFLGHYGSESELGAYAACVLYAASITQLRGAFEPTTSALVAPALARNDARGLSTAIKRQTRWLALLSFPLAAMFVGFGEPLLRVFGHGFARGHVALAVLAIGHVANALALSSFAIPLSGNARFTTYVAACAFVVETILCALLVPRFGVLGAAIAMSSGLVGAQLAQAVIAARVLRVVGVSFDVVVVALCAIVAVACGRALFASTSWPIIARFIASVGVAAFVYAVAAWIFAFTSGDRELARAAVRRVRILW
jgi:O-antigen/teichoic acid export membrane protein